MPEKRKQHYVPKLYMKRFSPDGIFYSIYSIKRKEIFESIPFANQCYKNYYYGQNLAVEDFLGEYEKKWENSFNNITSKECLSESDIKSIQEFALYQSLRTNVSFEHVKGQRDGLVIEYIKTLYARFGYTLDDRAKDEYIKIASKGLSPSIVIEIAKSIINTIYDLDIVIINYNTKHRLISSDNPVIAMNSFNKFSTGFSCIGLILLFPLTPNQLIVLYDSKMYPRYKGKRFVNLINESEVKHLNLLQFMSADNILFAYDKDDFPVLKDLDWIDRKKGIDSPKTSTLGTETDKIIGVYNKKIFRYYSFSFSQLSSVFQNIPFVCKHHFKRAIPLQNIEIAQNNAIVIPQVLSNEPDLLSSYNITKKELVAGYKRLIRALTNYANL